MANAIASLSVMLGLDTSKFTQGVIASRRELRAMDTIIKETMTPLETLQTQLDGIDRLRKKFGDKVPETIWERAIERVNADYREQVKLIEERNAVVAEVVPEPVRLRDQFGSEAMQRLNGTQVGALLAVAGPVAGAFVAAEIAISLAQKAGELFVGTIEAIATTALDGVRQLNAINDEAESLGMLSSEYQQLTIAAEYAGAPTDNLTMLIGKLNEKLGDPSTEMLDALDQMGLSADTLKKQTPVAQISAVMAELNKAPDRATKFALMADVFGKVDKKTVLLVDKFEAAMEAAEKLTITDSQFAGIGAADDGLRDVQLQLEKMKQELAAGLGPAISDLAGSLAELLGNDATQSVLLTGITALRDTLDEVAYIAKSLQDFDVVATASGVNEAMQAYSLKGFVAGQLAEQFTQPFFDQAQADRTSRDLERELRKTRASAASGVMDSIDLSNAELAQLEKERKAAQQTIIDQETRFAESMDKLRIERLEIVDEQASMEQRAIDAGAASRQQVDAYVAEMTALRELKKEKQDMAEAERKRLDEEKRLAQSREQILASLRTPFDRAKDEMQRAIEAGLDRTQLDAFGNKLVDGLLPKGTLGPVTGFQKGSREAVAFEQATARADRQSKLLQEIRDRLKPTLFDGAVTVEEVEL